MNMRQKAHKRIIQLVSQELDNRLELLERKHEVFFDTEEIELDKLLKEIKEKVMHLDD